MDGTAAIERNREALKRILATMMAMAGLKIRGQFTFLPPTGAPSQDLAPTERTRLSLALTLPRDLHLAVLRLLRPAEAAARRLVIALAATLPPPTLREARPATPQARKTETAPAILRNRVGTGIVMPRILGAPPLAARHKKEGSAGLSESPSFWRSGGKPSDRQKPPSCRPPSFPLFDPPRRLFRPAQARRAGVPRISVIGYTRPFAIPDRRPASPGDPVDATRLGQRLATLGRVLDDLPREALRFARWKARRDAEAGRAGPGCAGRIRRRLPLRPGRPPGGRLSVYDPFAPRPRKVREVDAVLAHAHALAVWALKRPDTS